MSDGQNGKGDRARPVDKETYDNNYEGIKWDKRCESCLNPLDPDEGEVVTVGLFGSVWCDACTELEFGRKPSSF